MFIELRHGLVAGTVICTQRVTNTRCRIGAVFSPDDGHIVARNTYRNAVKILRKIVHQVGSVYKIIQGCTINKTLKACPSESGTEVGAPLFPAVELCDFPGRWQCMSGEIWYTIDSGSVLLTEAEAR